MNSLQNAGQVLQFSLHADCCGFEGHLLSALSMSSKCVLFCLLQTGSLDGYLLLTFSPEGRAH